MKKFITPGGLWPRGQLTNITYSSLTNSMNAFKPLRYTCPCGVSCALKYMIIDDCRSCCSSASQGGQSRTTACTGKNRIALSLRLYTSKAHDPLTTLSDGRLPVYCLKRLALCSCLLLKPTSTHHAHCSICSTCRPTRASVLSSHIEGVAVASIICCAPWLQTTSRYPAGSLLPTGPTASCRSCHLYTPSQAAYSSVFRSH